MALASVLSIQLSFEPKGKDLERLCTRIDRNVNWAPSSDPTFMLVVKALKLIVETPYSVSTGDSLRRSSFENIPEDLSTTSKLWLSRVMLETLWRWRYVQESTTVIHFDRIESVCKRLMADGDQNLVILKTNCVLIMAISLGLSVNMRDLYAPSNRYILSPLSTALTD
jgi:hypothetical protein